MGLRQESTKADMAKAVLESIALQVFDCVQALPQKPRLLRVDGGVSQNAWLMQLQADLLEIPIEVLNFSDATVFGVSKFAASSLGYDLRAWKLDSKQVMPSSDLTVGLITRWQRAMELVLRR